MADNDSNSGESPSSSILSELTTKMAKVLTKVSAPTSKTASATVQIGTTPTMHFGPR